MDIEIYLLIFFLAHFPFRFSVISHFNYTKYNFFSVFHCSLKNKKSESTSPFHRPIIPLFWTPGDVCSGFQSQGRSLAYAAASSVCNGFLRFTCSATNHLLSASLVVEPFWIHILAHMYINIDLFIRVLFNFLRSYTSYGL